MVTSTLVNSDEYINIRLPEKDQRSPSERITDPASQSAEHTESGRKGAPKQPGTARMTPSIL